MTGWTTASSLQMLYIAWLVGAAAWDFARMRIPNLLTAAIAILALLNLAIDFGEVSWGAHLGAGAGLLLLGFVLFACGAIGGGDAKLLAVVGLWAGISDLPELLIVMAASGALLAFLLLPLRHLLWGLMSSTIGNRYPHLVPEGMVPGAGIPYGIAIAGGAILATLI
jgi:prepilin peptidase CpaA